MEYYLVEHKYVNCYSDYFEEKSNYDGSGGFYLFWFFNERRKFIFSTILDKSDKAAIDNLFDKNGNYIPRTFKINKYHFRFKKACYHKFTWDDYRRNSCNKSDVGTIECDKEGCPIRFIGTWVYSGLNHKCENPLHGGIMGSRVVLNPDYDETIREKYLDIDSEEAKELLNLN